VILVSSAVLSEPATPKKSSLASPVVFNATAPFSVLVNTAFILAASAKFIVIVISSFPLIFNS
jgi:hypothetical protein